MTRPRKLPRYTLIPHPDATADVEALAVYGPDVVAAAVAIVDDLAYGRVVGKELGDRHVSGDLTGFARVKFDVPGGHSGFDWSTGSSTTLPVRSSSSVSATSTPSTASPYNVSCSSAAVPTPWLVVVAARLSRLLRA